jgi:thioredoxin 1
MKIMIKRISPVAAILVALSLLTAATTAASAAINDYDADAVKKAQAAGKTVLLDFHADWCPVCRKQGPVIQGLLKEDRLKEIAAFKVNYDEEKALKKEMKVTRQSTLIVFKGAKEAARATGPTDKAAIRALLEKGL